MCPTTRRSTEQRERFDAACAALPGLGHTGRRETCGQQRRASARRAGRGTTTSGPALLLYGIVPPPLAATLALRPALSLHSRIVAVKGLRPGEGIGYGLRNGHDNQDGPRTIAVVPAGYADGLDLRLAGRGHMLVRGRRMPVVGSVCMDMSMIDVTGMDVAPGDEVVIVGRQQDEAIGVREIAASIGTIPYELLCRVGVRIQRLYES